MPSHVFQVLAKKKTDSEIKKENLQTERKQLKSTYDKLHFYSDGADEYIKTRMNTIDKMLDRGEFWAISEIPMISSS